MHAVFLDRTGLPAIALCGCRRVVWRNDELANAEIVDQLVMAGHETNKVFGALGQLPRDIAGMAVTASGAQLRPIIGAQIDTKSLHARLGAAPLDRPQRDRRRLLEKESWLASVLFMLVFSAAGSSL